LEDHTRYATHVVPMGNYVIVGVGNYVIVNPSNLGNYVIADTASRKSAIMRARDLEGGLPPPVRSRVWRSAPAWPIAFSTAARFPSELFGASGFSLAWYLIFSRYAECLLR